MSSQEVGKGGATGLLLLRQVHPNHVDPLEGPMRIGFCPTPKDRGLLSTLHGRVTPAEAHRRWTEDRGHKSAGTWAVSVTEVEDAALDYFEDGLDIGTPDHVSVDFNGILEDKAAVKQRSRMLAQAALQRGRLHP